ncbi:1-deoxy-D-xylulose-5-phosphate synthase [Rickettsiales endosymbiont of Stachyamoeba lipophora]|uniref:1-deoxy-D-xylulose-5-phosphate synthase n=1 Tax=Rickettsiales endosymbiont of Stachyamoeba lipophora TaxID=2486578 RepID=UPI000F655CEE|nr:1-deoxy-D-xylulose-5-phosphate synthase [Rickettsiales endosymbiont of Stachyamoeba lipophora]AZL16025.1 1-deoxy-D-xylulose-5-phosphate synthase [Rickettsiales endosymbiont of Stachyamoeba lipophora]
MTNLIDQINYPQDLRTLKVEQLPQICEELRQQTIEIISQTGGHLGAGLGVIELTIALHYVFDTPNDKLVWDIGHQTYPHKIITGRKEQMHTLRQGNGLSGFTKIKESEYDHFGAGHSSTSISAAFGMAVGRDLKQKTNHVVAIIGDGSLSAGMAYEALNHAGATNHKFLVVLNNNDMSIARPVGALSKYLSKITASKPYRSFRQVAKQALEHLPGPLDKIAKRTEQYLKNVNKTNDIFDDLGFYSIGPVDGHDVVGLVEILTQIRDDDSISSPFMLHIVTEKGKGFYPSKDCPEKFHAVSSFDPETLEQQKKSSSHLSYTKIFADTLCVLAYEDPKIIAITAAMPSGTGLNQFAKEFPERFFDVGIAEQHAVTFAAGLSCENYKPFVAIYSTFLQRAYDQVVHDIAVQNLPVRFAIDRAGLVGADGPTHAGSFDLTYLSTLPNLVIMAPSDGEELAHMVKTAACYDKSPIAFRYPRGESTITSLPTSLQILEIGKGRVVKQAQNTSLKIAFIAIGTILGSSLKAAEILEAEPSLSVTVFDARFAKPIDSENIINIAASHHILITLEENSIGGFAAQVTQVLTTNGLLDQGKLIYRNLFLPDNFIDQDTQNEMLKKAELDTTSIVQFTQKLINNSK